MTEVSPKRYGCSHCGAVSLESTNHWGEIYSACDACSWRRPLDVTVKVCIELAPEPRSADGWQVGEVMHFERVKVRNSDDEHVGDTFRVTGM